MIENARHQKSSADRPPRLAIVSTHPVQYHTPWYRALVNDGRLQIKVLFCHRQTPEQQAAAGFGVPFDWDLPLVDGYECEFLENVAKDPCTSAFNGIDVPSIGSHLREGRFDAVLVNGWNYKAAWQAVRAAKQLGLPLITRGDSHLRTGRSVVKRLLKRIAYPAMLRSFDVFLAVGKWSREYYLHYGTPVDRIFQVPHVIDESSLLFAARRWQFDREGIRRQWSLPLEATVFLFAGKFTGNKNPLDFLRAVNLAIDAGVPLAGLMVGDGPLRPDCEKFAREHRLPVAFAGFLNQSEIARAYVAANCLVLPSSSETWGIVVNEAMWCEIPCIVSDRVGCGPDLIDSNQTGAIVPLHDINSLAAAMARFARDPEICHSSGKRARRVIESYSIAAAVEGTFQAVLAARRGHCA